MGDDFALTLLPDRLHLFVFGLDTNTNSIDLPDKVCELKDDRKSDK